MRNLDSLVCRNVEELRGAWKRASRDRSRYALLPYAVEVLGFYRTLRARQEAKKAGERIAEIYEFDLRDDMHTIRCIIEMSSNGMTDNEKNRMTQALRYAFRRNWTDNVADKIKENGGIKGCADKFGKLNKGKRYSRAKKHNESRENWNVVD